MMSPCADDLFRVILRFFLCLVALLLCFFDFFVSCQKQYTEKTQRPKVLEL